MGQFEQLNRNKASGYLIFIGGLWMILATALLYYQFVKPASILVEWNTVTELETAGFNLYRAQSPEGELVLVNEALIPSKGDSLSGASYSYTDKIVEPGKTYYYVLEEVEFNATTNQHTDDMFSSTVRQVAWWAVVLTAVSLLVGLTLIIMGINERKNE